MHSQENIVPTIVLAKRNTGRLVTKTRIIIKQQSNDITVEHTDCIEKKVEVEIIDARPLVQRRRNAVVFEGVVKQRKIPQDAKLSATLANIHTGSWSKHSDNCICSSSSCTSGSFSWSCCGERELYTACKKNSDHMYKL
jgi:hypothetical protein